MTSDALIHSEGRAAVHRPWRARPGHGEPRPSGKAKTKNRISRIFLVFVFVCAIAFPFAEVQAIGRGGMPSPPTSAKTGRLIVQRAPNFGKDLVLRLSIDGKKVADIPRNQHYGDLISAGHHTVAVLAMPNNRLRRQASIRLTVKSGRVYIYTAAWDRDRLVLKPSDLYSPTKRVNGL